MAGGEISETRAKAIAKEVFKAYLEVYQRDMTEHQRYFAVHHFMTTLGKALRKNREAKR